MTRAAVEPAIARPWWRRVPVAVGVLAAAAVVASSLGGRSASGGAPGHEQPVSAVRTSAPAASPTGGPSSQLRGSPVTGRLTVSVPLAGPPGVFGTVRATAPTAPEAGAAPSQRVSIVPSRVSIGASVTGPSARVVPVDTQADGRLAIPPDPKVVGWWRSGAMPGDPFGGVVLVGHIDTAASGVGYFARLLRLRPGDVVSVDDGRTQLRYRVHAVSEVAKDALNRTTDAFSQRVPGRLVLITCTGTFDPVARHYNHNLVVSADPVGAPVTLTR